METRNDAATHVTVAELARRWKVSENYIRRLMWDRRLSVTRFGRAVRIPLAAAERFVREQTG